MMVDFHKGCLWLVPYVSFVVRAVCSHDVALTALFLSPRYTQVDEAFKVKEYDEEGNEVQNVSTLDEFEHFFKLYVDTGLGLFALVTF